MLELIKKILHFSADDTSYDDEINQHIAACRADLIRSGILATKVTGIDNDPAITNCIVAFCESRMADVNLRDKYIAIYVMYKAELLISEDYIGVLATETV